MTYATLKTDIAAWMHRSDLTAQIDTFIDLFEARANRNLRVPEMEVRSITTLEAEYVALPSDFLEVRNVQLNADRVLLLEYASPQKIDAMRLVTGDPRYYSVVGNEMQFSPPALDSEIEIDYYAKIPALSDSNTSNWLLDSNPDYYLMGALYEASLYTQDASAAQLAALVAEKEEAINRRGRGKNYGAGPLVVSAV